MSTLKLHKGLWVVCAGLNLLEHMNKQHGGEERNESEISWMLMFMVNTYRTSKHLFLVSLNTISSKHPYIHCNLFRSQKQQIQIEDCDRQCSPFLKNMTTKHAYIPLLLHFIAFLHLGLLAVSGASGRSVRKQWTGRPQEKQTPQNSPLRRH